MVPNHARYQLRYTRKCSPIILISSPLVKMEGEEKTGVFQKFIVIPYMGSGTAPRKAFFGLKSGA